MLLKSLLVLDPGEVSKFNSTELDVDTSEIAFSIEKQLSLPEYGEVGLASSSTDGCVKPADELGDASKGTELDSEAVLLVAEVASGSEKDELCTNGKNL